MAGLACRELGRTAEAGSPGSAYFAPFDRLRASKARATPATFRSATVNLQMHPRSAKGPPDGAALVLVLSVPSPLNVGMPLVSAPLVSSDSTLPVIAIRADRMILTQRSWRGAADDGTEFSFELSAPLQHGDTVFQTSSARYVIRQLEEPVVEIPLEQPASAAAGIGWAIGNLHLALSAEPTRLIAADEPAVRQLLDRLNVPYRSTIAVFRPGRFSRGALPNHDLGSGHKH